MTENKTREKREALDPLQRSDVVLWLRGNKELALSMKRPMLALYLSNELSFKVKETHLGYLEPMCGILRRTEKPKAKRKLTPDLLLEIVKEGLCRVMPGAAYDDFLQYLESKLEIEE